MSALRSQPDQDLIPEDMPTAEPADEAQTVSGGKRGWVGGLQILGVIGFVAVALGFSSEGVTTDEAAAADPSPATSPAPAPDATADAASGTSAAARQPLVNVATPVAGAGQATVRATGSVTVRNRVQLVPEVDGRVVAVSAALRAGGSFAAGEELLRVEDSDFRLALKQAQADLSIATSKLRLKTAEGDAARANYALINPGKAVPPLVAKTPQIDQARAEVAAAEARVAMAELELSRTRFSLPFAGRITSTTAEVGQVLSANQSFGQAFALDALEITVPMAQDELAQLSEPIGRTATVTAGDVNVEAIVERVSAELDERTRFAKVFLTFTADTSLAPGTFVDVLLRGPELPSTFMLPASAEQTGGRLWVVDAGHLREVSPQIIDRTEQGLLVTAFDAADGVVLGPVPSAREGLAVRTDSIGS